MVDEALARQFMWESAKEVFGTMISLPLEQTDRQDDLAEQSAALVCSITFTGQLQGCFLIQCRITAAEQIARAMLMAEPDQPISDDEISDAVGEVVNMIIGGVKKRLEDVITDMQISIPSTVKGREVIPTLGRAAKRAELAALTQDNFLRLMIVYTVRDN